MKKQIELASNHVMFCCTRDVAVWRQYGTWYAPNKVIQFMPSAPFGVVICAEYPGVFDEKPYYSWVIYRGTSLVVSFDAQVDYAIDTASNEDMYTWYKRFRAIGQTIGTNTIARVNAL